MKIVVTGATGFIGKAAVIHLARLGHEITAIVRKEGSASDLPCKSFVWDSSSEDASSLTPALNATEAVIHLAGEPVANSRWTTETKEAIRTSRVDGTRKLIEAVSKLLPVDRPKLIVSGSAIGIYGDRGNEEITELTSAGPLARDKNEFLASVTFAWESEAQKAEALGVRVVRLRTGIVLGRDGGALQKMQPVVLGDGKQWMSWIHLEDEVRFIAFALTNQEISGAYNLTSPSPVRNSEFTKKLAKARRFPFVVSTPKFVLKAVLGEMSTVLFASCKALPNRAVEQGFQFTYPTLSLALDQIYASGDPLEQRMSVTQFVPKPVEEVFDFFSKAENLEEITPPFLNFQISSKSTQAISENTLINYRLKIHGVPAKWQSKIERWVPNVEFVDTQIKGPYAKWHHTHRFEKVSGGTLVSDDVIYKVPGGRMGKALLSAFIRRDVTQIFAYRKKKIAEVFKS